MDHGCLESCVEHLSGLGCVCLGKGDEEGIVMKESALSR